MPHVSMPLHHLRAFSFPEHVFCHWSFPLLAQNNLRLDKKSKEPELFWSRCANLFADKYPPAGPFWSYILQTGAWGRASKAHEPPNLEPAKSESENCQTSSHETNLKKGPIKRFSFYSMKPLKHMNNKTERSFRTFSLREPGNNSNVSHSWFISTRAKDTSASKFMRCPLWALQPFPLVSPCLCDGKHSFCAQTHTPASTWEDAAERCTLLWVMPSCYSLRDDTPVESCYTKGVLECHQGQLS